MTLAKSLVNPVLAALLATLMLQTPADVIVSVAVATSSAIGSSVMFNNVSLILMYENDLLEASLHVAASSWRSRF